MKKVWIAGAAGHVGTALKNLLDTEQYNLLMTDKAEVNVTDQDAVHSYMMVNRPEVVINCAAVTSEEKCMENPDKAYKVNAIGARNLAIECEMLEGKLIQLSTDDVFDIDEKKIDIRKMRPYNEFDTPRPAALYGKSKYAGEQLVENLSSRFVIIRSSWVYGTGRDFVNAVIDAAENRASLQVPVNHMAAPTSAKELAKIVTHFIDNESYGIYHAVCTGMCSRFAFAKEILKILGREQELELIPVSENDGVKPVYTVLDNMMLRLDDVEEPCDWREALEEYLEETGGNE